MKCKKACVFTGIFILTITLISGITACTGKSATTMTTKTTPTVTPTANLTLPPGGAFSENRTPPSMNWAAVAEKLGVTEEKLRQALENSGQGMFDLKQAALTLGVTEEALREALGFPQGGPGESGNGPRPSGTPPTGFPSFTPPDETNKTTTS